MTFEEYCTVHNVSEIGKPAAFEAWMKLQFAAGLKEGTEDD